MAEVSVETMKALSRSLMQPNKSARLIRCEEVCVSLMHDLGVDSSQELAILINRLGN